MTTIDDIEQDAAERDRRQRECLRANLSRISAARAILEKVAGHWVWCSGSWEDQFEELEIFLAEVERFMAGELEKNELRTAGMEGREP